MKVKIVKRDGKYRRKFSLEAEDWITVFIVVLVLAVALIQVILWS